VENLTAKIHEEDGSYWAEVEELPGCFASGDTTEELAAALQEAVGLYLSSPGRKVDARMSEMILQVTA
jgi:predicted RNase H-like HicB family nuclease